MSKRKASSPIELPNGEEEDKVDGKRSSGGGGGKRSSFGEGASLIPSSSFKFGTPSAAAGAGVGDTDKTETAGTLGGDDPSETSQFKNLAPEVSGKMRALNEEFIATIASVLSQYPDGILQPLLESYIQHVENILKPVKYAKLAVCLKSKENSSNGSDPFTSGYFSHVPNRSIFASKSVENQKTSSKAITSGFSVMAKPAPVPSSTSVGIPNPLTKVIAPISAFSILPAPPQPPTIPFQAESNQDEEAEEPPKVEFKQVTEDNAMYNVRCKVFEKVDETFKDKGVGQLFVKKLENKKFQLVVRAENTLGTILMNVLLQKGLPLTLKGKEIWTCDPTDKRKLMVIRVKNADAATELLNKIQEFLPKS